jgi:hypothetical protein
MRDKYSQPFVDGYLPSVVVPSASRIHEIRVRIGALDPFDGALCHGEKQRGVLSNKGGPVWSSGLIPVLAQIFIDLGGNNSGSVEEVRGLYLRLLNGSAVS